MRDVEQRHLFRPGKMHVLNHKGKYFSVRGPAQHRPARPGLAGDRPGRRLRRGSPARGRDSGGGVRGRGRNMANGQRFYADMKGRMRESRPQSRAPEDPSRRVGGGRRQPQGGAARSARGWTASSTTPMPSRSLSIALGHDASRFDPDGPLPEIPETQCQQERARAGDRAGASGRT